MEATDLRIVNRAQARNNSLQFEPKTRAGKFGATNTPEEFDDDETYGKAYLDRVAGRKGPDR